MTAAVHHRRGGRQGDELRWPNSPAERERAFENWQAASMQCLREGNSDFALIVALRKSLRSDGRIVATNAELAFAAGYSSKTLEFDLGRLKRRGLIACSFQAVKGFSGLRRVIRLSNPPTDYRGKT